jgi:cytochrome c
MRQRIQIAIVLGIAMFGMGTLGLSDGRAQTSAQAPGGEPDAAVDGAVLYTTRTCVACHGKDASTPLLPNYPKLAGQNPEYLLQQMKDIKSGARSNGQTPAMRGIMHLVDEREMEALAAFLSEFVPATTQ